MLVNIDGALLDQAASFRCSVQGQAGFGPLTWKFQKKTIALLVKRFPGHFWGCGRQTCLDCKAELLPC